MANYGTYATLDDIRADLAERVTDTTDDTRLLRVLEVASRWIDSYCRRVFYTVTDTRYFTPAASGYLSVDDLLSVTTLKSDEDDDLDYDYTWTTGDYLLEPHNGYPKGRIGLHPSGDYSFPSGLTQSVQIAGVYGYGNGQSATPYEATGYTGTVATTTGTTLTLSEAGAVQAGQNILLGTEQMYVTAVASTAATVKRGVNGTTAAIQTAAAISAYLYPDEIREACLQEAKRLWRRKDAPQGELGGAMGVVTIRLLPDLDTQRLLNPYRRLEL